jgi:hypothetical protein
MATPGDTISIESVTALETFNRFNTIKFTFTGVLSIESVSMFDFNRVLISTLKNVESGYIYAIETGEIVSSADGTVASPWGFFALPPMPVHIIDFITLGVDMVPGIQPVITNIQVGSKMRDGDSIVWVEVNDPRAIPSPVGVPPYSLIAGGNPLEWPRDPVTGMYLDSLYISAANIQSFQGFFSSGDVVPMMGHDVKDRKMDIGMMNHDLFKKFSGAI